MLSLYVRPGVSCQTKEYLSDRLLETKKQETGDKRASLIGERALVGIIRPPPSLERGWGNRNADGEDTHGKRTMDADVRVGMGYDLHRLVRGRALVLAGVRIEYEFGLAGHSDADVVLHAVTDALLGAAGLPDIGEMFPDTDPRYKDADSRVLLAAALDAVEAKGFAVGNVDVIVHAERPKLSAHKRAMRESIAGVLGVAVEDVNVKAKTNEGVDAVGRGEAIACTAVACVRRRSGG